LELTATHTNTVGILQGKATMEQYRQDLADMETGEREKINATRQGSTERLEVINAALRAEEFAGLTSTAHYRELHALVEFAMWAGLLEIGRNPILLVQNKGATRKVRKPRSLSVEQFHFCSPGCANRSQHYSSNSCAWAFVLVKP